MKELTLVLWGALVVARPADSLATEPSEMRVEGSFTTQVVACASMCTRSVYRDDLEGTSDFVLISLEPTSDPDVVRYVGSLVLRTADGTLVGEDSGTWNTRTGKYNDRYEIHGGTGAFAGATGALHLKGTLDAVTGRGVSEYKGKIVWAE